MAKNSLCSFLFLDKIKEKKKKKTKNKLLNFKMKNISNELTMTVKFTLASNPILHKQEKSRTWSLTHRLHQDN